MSSPEAASADGPLRIVLVDDHELIRTGLARSFERDPSTVVVGQAGSVVQAMAVIEEQAPAVVVTDLQLPDGSGLDIIRAIRQRDAGMGLIVLTMHAGDDQIFAAMEAGASAFVGKDSPSREVVGAARHAGVAPRNFLCSGLADAMMRRVNDDRPRLSKLEAEVLDLLAEGLGTGAIAKKLYMSESTVKSHIAKIYQKLGATNRAQALVTAMRIGLLSSVIP